MASQDQAIAIDSDSDSDDDDSDDNEHVVVPVHRPGNINNDEVISISSSSVVASVTHDTRIPAVLRPSPPSSQGGRRPRLSSGLDAYSAIELDDDDSSSSSDSDENAVICIPGNNNNGVYYHHQQQQQQQQQQHAGEEDTSSSSSSNIEQQRGTKRRSTISSKNTSPRNASKKKKRTSTKPVMAQAAVFDEARKAPPSPTPSNIRKVSCPLCWCEFPEAHVDSHIDWCGRSQTRRAAVAAASENNEDDDSASSSSLSSHDDDDDDDDDIVEGERRSIPPKPQQPKQTSKRKSKPPVKIPRRPTFTAVDPKNKGGGARRNRHRASSSSDNNDGDKKPAAKPSRREQHQQRETSRAKRSRRDLADDDNDNNDSIPWEERKMPGSNNRTTPNNKSSTIKRASKTSMSAEADREYPPALRDEVETTLRHVRERQKQSRMETMRKMLIAKNTLLQGRKSSDVIQPLPNYRRLPRVESQLLDSSYLRHEDYPIPKDSHHTTFLRKHFSSLGAEKGDDDSDDNGNNKGAPPSPYLDDRTDDDNTVDSEEKPLSPSKRKFVKQIEEFRLEDRVGVGYEDDEMDSEMDKVLENLKDTKYNRQKVHEYLAILFQTDINRVTTRWEKISGTEEPRRQYKTRYEEVMSSFRDLFCRRCLVFDCNLHGLQEDYPPDIQLELAIRLENSGYWKEETGDEEVTPMCLPVQGSVDQNENISVEPRQPEIAATSTQLEVRILTEEQKEICKRMYQVFQNDLSICSEVMGIPEATIKQQVELVPFEFKLSDPPLSKSKQNKSNTYNQEWVKRIVQATSHPFFKPCTHIGQCSEENCSCVQNRFFCTKACIWGASSRNFFRGCNCASKCQQKSCPCFAANRECDPDLCRRCGACSDEPNTPATEQKCRNDNIAMRRHGHLLLAKSRVAGWGCYTKHALKKGDYVHEYVGELIPHNEAERRGEIYDTRNQTYIFDMSTDYAVDAMKKGNKTRFINHSDDPNVEPQMKVINGDYRIGFFALKDITAQTELFFDYGDKFFKAKGAFTPQNANQDTNSHDARKK